MNGVDSERESIARMLEEKAVARRVEQLSSTVWAKEIYTLGKLRELQADGSLDKEVAAWLKAADLVRARIGIELIE